MAHLVYVAQEWDLARYGSVDITWTDDSGAGQSITAVSTGKYRHATSAANSLTHPDGGTAVANSTNVSWAPVLEALMDAATAQTITLTYSDTTNRYTLACSGAVFSVTWAAGAETRMKKLLGFSGNLSGSTSYTSDVAPYFTLEPRRNAFTGWTDVRAVADSVSTRMTGSADMISVGPARVPYTARVEFSHETDAQTLAEYEKLFSWQTFWNDAGRYSRLCYLCDVSPPVGSMSRWAFKLRAPVFDESTHRREKNELRNRWRIMLDVLLRGRY